MSGDPGVGVRLWRPPRRIRIAGAGIAILGLGLAAGSYAAWAGGEMAVPTLVAAVVTGVILAGAGIGYALRNRVVFAGGVLTITNLWRTYRIPVEKLVAVVMVRGGAVFGAGDGKFYQARALELSVYRRWDPGNGRALAKAAAEDLMAAAEQARRDRGLDPNPPRPPAAKVSFLTKMVWTFGFGFFALNALAWTVVFTQLFKR